MSRTCEAAPSTPAAPAAPAAPSTPAAPAAPSTPAEGSAGIGVENLTVRFGGAVAVRGVSMHVAPGEWLGVIGPNGAGKTTLLRAIAQLESHDGSVSIGSEPMKLLSARRRARLVAYLPQAPQLPAEMEVADYVLLGRNAHIGYFGVESDRDRAICARLLDRLGLSPLAGRRLSTLSGGERHRVVVCRALAQQAPVLLLDEPTSDLDLGRRVDVLDLVDELRREARLTVVSTMHDLTLAAQFAERLILIDKGSVAASGTPGEILREELLSKHFGGSVAVTKTEDGTLVVSPRRRRSAS